MEKDNTDKTTEIEKDEDEIIRDELVAILENARQKTDDLYNAASQKYHAEICGITDDISSAIRELKALWR